MQITILGSCRQDSLYGNFNVSCIRNDISYPHYTKEVIQVLHYCLYNNLKESDTHIFRTPMLTNKFLSYNPSYKDTIINTDIFFIEIASRKYYKLHDNYVHHILFDDEKYNDKYKDSIICGDLTDHEIEEDIKYIIQLLGPRRVIFVTHLVTREGGSRHDLASLVENICEKENVSCINPVKELLKTNDCIKELIHFEEEIIAHYTEKGHEEILKIYKKTIENI